VRRLALLAAAVTIVTAAACGGGGAAPGPPAPPPPATVARATAAPLRTAPPACPITPSSAPATRAVITLEKGGTITLTLRADKAPRTVANFVNVARSGCYNGLTFHPLPKLRTVIWEFAGEEVPAALRADAARLVLTVAHELRRRGGGLGLATLCGGIGEGECVIVRVDHDR